jgi:hypothetical protein
MSKPTPAIPLQQLSDALTDIVERAAPSVVAVHSTRSRSSGFVWRASRSETPNRNQRYTMALRSPAKPLQRALCDGGTPHHKLRQISGEDKAGNSPGLFDRNHG